MRTWDCYYWPTLCKDAVKFARVESHTKEEARMLAMKRAPGNFGKNPNDYFVICTDGAHIKLT
jgi:hypothetical protein